MMSTLLNSSLDESNLPANTAISTVCWQMQDQETMMLLCVIISCPPWPPRLLYLPLCDRYTFRPTAICCCSYMMMMMSYVRSPVIPTFCNISSIISLSWPLEVFPAFLQYEIPHRSVPPPQCRSSGQSPCVKPKDERSS